MTLKEYLKLINDFANDNPESLEFDVVVYEDGDDMERLVTSAPKITKYPDLITKAVCLN
jgi:hypothetical protein